MASALASLLRRLAAVALVVLLCVGFISPAEAKGKAAKTISPEDMAASRRSREAKAEAIAGDLNEAECRSRLCRSGLRQHQV